MEPGGCISLCLSLDRANSVDHDGRTKHDVRPLSLQLRQPNRLAPIFWLSGPHPIWPHHDQLPGALQANQCAQFQSV